MGISTLSEYGRAVGITYQTPLEATIETADKVHEEVRKVLDGLRDSGIQVTIGPHIRTIADPSAINGLHVRKVHITLPGQPTVMVESHTFDDGANGCRHDLLGVERAHGGRKAHVTLAMMLAMAVVLRTRDKVERALYKAKSAAQAALRAAEEEARAAAAKVEAATRALQELDEEQAATLALLRDAFSRFNKVTARTAPGGYVNIPTDAVGAAGNAAVAAAIAAAAAANADAGNDADDTGNDADAAADADAASVGSTPEEDGSYVYDSEDSEATEPADDAEAGADDAEAGEPADDAEDDDGDDQE